jgi:hypothetical protein
MSLTRVFVPMFLWVPSRLKREAITAFWRYYNNSALRRLRHRLFPKHQGS